MRLGTRAANVATRYRNWLVALIAVILVGWAVAGRVSTGASSPPPSTAHAATEKAPVVEKKAPSAAGVIVDVLAIAGKTGAEVDRLLGQPSSVETTKNKGKSLPVRLYRSGKVKVVFVEGKADWISVYELSPLPFAPTSLPALGLPRTDPAWRNAKVMRWTGISGLSEVSFFRGESHSVDYAYVCAFTSP